MTAIDVAKMNALSVWYLATPSHPRKVGTVTLVPRQQRCAFVYAKSWADAGGFALSHDMPLDGGNGTPILAPRDWSAPGALEDALPDRWGYQSILTIDRPTRLTPLDLLYYAGDRRFGALGISADPDAYLPFPNGPLPTKPSLDAANELIQRIIDKLPVDERDRMILASSKSMGGARPKMLVDIDGEEWIVKFPKGEMVDLPLIEHASMALADAAGIRVATTCAHRISTGHVILVKRFDRRGSERIHALSSRTMLLQAGEESYAAIADILRANAPIDIMNEQRQEIFSRMVFNILMDNTDDHTKNHSFLMLPDGHWELSPAYDLLPQMQGEGKQAIPIAAGMQQDDLETALANSLKFGLSLDEAIASWRKITVMVDQWQAFFVSLGVSGHDIDQLTPFIDSPEKLALRHPSAADRMTESHQMQAKRPTRKRRNPFSNE